ncbi:MAG: hypothetical protein NWE95_03365 [Candidatus Bathyarchaeota archaeon]|nr:hypothetical protein [Candidatus Bathyarchaeota archaeon]
MRRKGMFKLRFLADRRGTAEVIGSILFIIILMFLFTNVYLWHDAAVKDANAMHLKQMNAGMELSYANQQLNVTAKGSDISLYRLWVAKSNGHYYAELNGRYVAAGNYSTIVFNTLDFRTVDGNPTSTPVVGVGDRLAVVNTLGIKVEMIVR